MTRTGQSNLCVAYITVIHKVLYMLDQIASKYLKYVESRSYMTNAYNRPLFFGKLI